jgi:hypothetical protein
MQSIGSGRSASLDRGAHGSEEGDETEASSVFVELVENAAGVLEPLAEHFDEGVDAGG